MAKKRKSSPAKRSGARNAARATGSSDLEALVQKCADDPAFFDYLLREPDPALESSGITFSPGLAERVKSAIQDGRFVATVQIDQLKAALQIALSGGWPPPTWLCVWTEVGPPRALDAAGVSRRRVASKASAPGRRRR